MPESSEKLRVYKEKMMGRRGPKPTPKSILKARGSWRANLAANSPEPEAGEPPMPAWLSTAGKKHWRQICPMLLRSNVLTALDGPALGLLCEAMARYVDAKRIVDKEGVTTVTANGNVMPHPAHTAATTFHAQLMKMFAVFGMTPADRTRIEALPAPKTESEEDAFLRRFKLTNGGRDEHSAPV